VEEAFKQVSSKATELEARLQTQASESSSGGAATTQVSKWAPNSFDGKEENWPSFKTKLVGFLSTFLRGQIGEWFNHVDLNRLDSAKVAATGPNCKQAAA